MQVKQTQKSMLEPAGANVHLCWTSAFLHTVGGNKHWFLRGNIELIKIFAKCNNAWNGSSLKSLRSHTCKDHVSALTPWIGGYNGIWSIPKFWVYNSALKFVFLNPVFFVALQLTVGKSQIKVTDLATKYYKHSHCHSFKNLSSLVMRAP